ncbi:hypothetical protein SAMN05444336_102532 [Albimonas donghaensis]|uniref:Uncharacterized protein n=2 Tax=Albimonas donghaensis TaxID=356660 RepID=A0A1H2WXT8_9RHOB|nr:hypothetical protein SAMN05444336_102532 [Albimonas donghaensis]
MFSFFVQDDDIALGAARAAALDAARAAAHAAPAAARAAYAALDVALDAAHAAPAAATRAAYAALDVALDATHAALDAAHADTDAATATDAALAAEEMVGPGLWLDAQPEALKAAWKVFRQQLLDADEGWEVWTDWYDARLRGDPVDWPLERARMLIPDDKWRKGPKVLNAEIARLIEAHSQLPLPELTPPVRDVDVLDPEVITSRLSSGPAPEFGTEAELAERRAARALIADVRGLIQEEVRHTERQGIGGNNPPEGERIVEEFADQASNALDALDAELEKPEPDLVDVAKSASVLRDVLRWFGRKLDKASDSFAGAFGALAAGALTANIAGVEVSATLGSLLTQLEKWAQVVLNAP